MFDHKDLIDVLQIYSRVSLRSVDEEVADLDMMIILFKIIIWFTVVMILISYI